MKKRALANPSQVQRCKVDIAQTNLAEVPPGDMEAGQCLCQRHLLARLARLALMSGLLSD
jgi:hypothetical protein